VIPSQPPALPTEPEPAPDDHAALLRAFLTDRDVPCPSCGYNLRNTPGERCGECGAALVLAVGRRHVPLRWWLLIVIPLWLAAAEGVYEAAWNLNELIQGTLIENLMFDPIYAIKAGVMILCIPAAILATLLRPLFLKMPQPGQIAVSGAVCSVMIPLLVLNLIYNVWWHW
jgi:hypothetical protein